jgi:hypothetical protein
MQEVVSDYISTDSQTQRKGKIYKLISFLLIEDFATDPTNTST